MEGKKSAWLGVEAFGDRYRFDLRDSRLDILGKETGNSLGVL